MLEGLALYMKEDFSELVKECSVVSNIFFLNCTGICYQGITMTMGVYFKTLYAYELGTVATQRVIQ